MQMDMEQMENAIQELREFRAATEPRMDRLEKKSDEHSGKLTNINVELAELRVDFNAFAKNVTGIIANTKWWIMVAITIVGAMAKWL
jgi:chromosome segregation ATPase